MVKFGELRIQQLKKELEERNLPISGQKADLQARLREAMEADGINVDEFEFVGPETSTKVEEKVEEQRTSSSGDMNMLLVAFKQIIAENISQITENAVQTENRLAQQIAENAKNAVQAENRLAQQITQIAENTSQLESRLTQQITENNTQLEKRLVQQITENNTQVQEKFSKFEDELSTIKNDEENLRSEFLQLSVCENCNYMALHHQQIIKD
ncbi:SAFB-like transcription modulator [Bactrocera dorsalis]|uniref:SAFB-like transcription modulator n=1 Tax=Bactrocera dorsalis TaxID=27457 RepID=A0ABM3JAH9_BACDO|nr:SAFB-like transcription modulator [Bactrocera dorsalis]